MSSTGLRCIPILLLTWLSILAGCQSARVGDALVPMELRVVDATTGEPLPEARILGMKPLPRTPPGVHIVSSMDIHRPLMTGRDGAARALVQADYRRTGGILPTLTLTIPEERTITVSQIGYEPATVPATEERRYARSALVGAPRYPAIIRTIRLVPLDPAKRTELVPLDQVATDCARGLAAAGAGPTQAAEAARVIREGLESNSVRVTAWDYEAFRHEWPDVLSMYAGGLGDLNTDPAKEMLCTLSLACTGFFTPPPTAAEDEAFRDGCAAAIEQALQDRLRPTLKDLSEEEREHALRKAQADALALILRLRSDGFFLALKSASVPRPEKLLKDGIAHGWPTAADSPQKRDAYLHRVATKVALDAISDTLKPDQPTAQWGPTLYGITGIYTDARWPVLVTFRPSERPQ